MIIRARPKYLNLDFIDNLDQKTHSPPQDENELFFNTGRSSLKFLFDQFKTFYKRDTLIVAMQSFNCEAVMEAALQARIKIILLDIGLEDFSIRLKDLIYLTQKPDFLLLTHYQGIPNIEYIKIIEYCRKNNILIIDDLAQCINSSINDIPLGSLSEFQLNSFAFDKPFSCFKGGSLTFGSHVNKEFLHHLQMEYKKLNFELSSDSTTDIKLLRFIYFNSTKKNYIKNINRYSFIRPLINLNFSESHIYLILSMTIFTVYAKLLNLLKEKFKLKTKVINVLKLREDKISLIQKQRSIYNYDNLEVAAVEKFFVKKGIQILEYPNSKIDWNRYSILDKSETLKKELRDIGIEAGNYAWPHSLHILYEGNENVTFQKSYKNSEYASKYIINIPIWSDFFRTYN